MSVKHHPFSADTVEVDFIKEICPGEFDALSLTLDAADYSLMQLGCSANNGGDIEGELGLDLDDEFAELIVKAYEKLCMEFQERTGLELDIKYSESFGNEYWEVEGVYILSPAGEKYQDKITSRQWTEFG